MVMAPRPPTWPLTFNENQGLLGDLVVGFEVPRDPPTVTMPLVVATGLPAQPQVSPARSQAGSRSSSEAQVKVWASLSLRAKTSA